MNIFKRISKIKRLESELKFVSRDVVPSHVLDRAYRFTKEILEELGVKDSSVSADRIVSGLQKKGVFKGTEVHL